MNGTLYCPTEKECTIQALHGFGGDGEDFLLIQAYSQMSWCCMDLMGHGRSPKSPVAKDYSVHKQVQQVHAQKKGKVLLGYSMGARLALHSVLRFPNSWEGLVLISGTAGLQENRVERQKWDRGLAEKLLSSTHDEFWSYWRELPIIVSQKDICPSFQRKRNMRRQKIDLASLAASVLGFGAGVMPTVWGKLGEVTLPVLIIVGEKDNKYREIGSRLHAKLQHSSLFVVPNVGHAPQLEDPETLANVIDDWISTLHR